MWQHVSQISFNLAATTFPRKDELESVQHNKQKSEKFYLQDIIIEDEAGGNHYVSLISRISNKETVELVKQDIEKFNK